MYPFVAEVEYWDDFNNPWELRREFYLIYAENYTDVVSQIESGYVDNLETIKVSGVDDRHCLFTVPEEIAKNFIQNGCVYHVEKEVDPE